MAVRAANIIVDSAAPEYVQHMATDINNAINSLNSAIAAFAVVALGSNVALLDTEDQVLAGGARVTPKLLATGNITPDPGDRPLQYIANSGAFTITAPVDDGSLMLLVINDGSAGVISFSGFTVGSDVGAALTTTDTHRFTISIWRINSTSGYHVFAHQ